MKISKLNKIITKHFAESRIGIKQKMESLFNTKPKIAYKNFTEDFPLPQSQSLQTQQQISSSKLQNGVTVISETPGMDRTVQMGLLLKLGTRDETKQTSGALHSIHTSYYKSFANTSETINYGMVQMSGGKFSMSFNREHTLFKCSCQAHDVVDLFGMMVDCSLEPRNFNSTGVAIEKLPYSYKFQEISGGRCSFTDIVFNAVFGDRNLGQPLWGNPTNFEKLDAYLMQQFQLEHIQPENIVVCGLGVENHGEFEELAESKLSELFYNKNVQEREKAVFQENDVRIPSTDSQSKFLVAFEAPDISNKDLLYYYIMQNLLGQVEVNQHDPLQMNKSMLNENIYKKENFVNGLESRNFHFTDSGMFVLRADLSGDNVNKVVDSLSQESQKLQKISQADFEASKKALKVNLLMNSENQSQRVEEFMKEQSSWGEVRFQDFVNSIDNLDLKTFQNKSKKLFNSKMCVVLSTPNLANIYTYDQIKNKFKQ